MEEVTIGSVVYLNSYDGIKFTVISSGSFSGDFVILGYNLNTNEFVTFTVNKSALTLVK